MKIYLKKVFSLSSLLFAQSILTMEQECLPIYTAIDNGDVSTLENMLIHETSKIHIKELGHVVLQRAIFSQKKNAFDFLINANCCDINECKQDYIREWSHNLRQPYSPRSCGYTFLEVLDQNCHIKVWSEYKNVLDVLRAKGAVGVLEARGPALRHGAEYGEPCKIQ